MASTIKVNFIGDNKDLNRTIADTDGKLAGLGGKVGGFAKTAGLALGGAAVVGGAALLKMAEGAAEDEAAAAALAKTLKNVTGATDAGVSSLEDWISAQGKAFGVADDDLRPALDVLVRGTKDVSKAQKGASLAMDISAGTGKDLATVADALAKAYQGNTKSLRNLSPEMAQLIKDGASTDEIMSTLAKTFEGQAATAADTTAGKLKIAKLQFAEMQEEIGAKVLPVLAQLATWANEKLIPALGKIAVWIEENVVPALKEFGAWLGEHLPPVIEAISKFITEQVVPALQAIAKWIAENVVPQVESFVHWLRDELGPALEKLWKSFQENILPILQDFATFVRDEVLPVLGEIVKWIAENVLPIVGDLVIFILEKLIPAFFDLVKFINDHVVPIFEGIRNVIRDDVIPVVQEIIDKFQAFWDKVSEVAGFIKDAVKTMADFVIEQVERMVGPLDSAISKFERVSGINLPFGGGDAANDPKNIANAEKLLGRDLNGNGLVGKAMGGAVAAGRSYLVGERGPELLTMGSNGFVTPNHRLGGGPTTIVLEVDGRVLSQVVVDESNRAGGLPIRVRAAS